MTTCAHFGRMMWIKGIGTHRDYDSVDVKEVQHGD